MREIEEMLKIPKSIIDRHIQRLGLLKKNYICIPHELKEIHLNKRINACDLHLKRNEVDPFLKQIITGDDQKKIVLSVWWDWKGMVFFELLPRNQTINSDVYCRQLNKLIAAVKEKRPELVNHRGVIFYYINATSHTSLSTRQKLLRLGWEVMLHSPYSPDLAPPDYYLFRSLQNSLNGKTFNYDKAVKSHLVQFFADKDQKFYKRGIVKLPEIWQKVIEQKGKHIIN